MELCWKHTTPTPPQVEERVTKMLGNPPGNPQEFEHVTVTVTVTRHGDHVVCIVSSHPKSLQTIVTSIGTIETVKLKLWSGNHNFDGFNAINGLAAVQINEHIVPFLTIEKGTEFYRYISQLVVMELESKE
jgi:hypothetical protein